MILRKASSVNYWIFSRKIKNAQDAGAIGVIIADNTTDPVENISEGEEGPEDDEMSEGYKAMMK